MNAPLDPDESSDSSPKHEFKKQKQKSFIHAESFLDEFRIVSWNFLNIAFQNIANVIPQIVSNIFVGHLANANQLLAGVGLARTFINVTGIDI